MRFLPKNRAARLFLVLFAAALATAGSFGVVHLLSDPGDYLRSLFFERSWIQYVIVYAFYLTTLALAVQHVLYLNERSAYETVRELLRGPEFRARLTWPQTHVLRDKLDEQRFVRFHNTVTFTRIFAALDRLSSTQSTKAVEDYFKNRIEIDRSEVEASYAGIRYLMWLIPTMGFIGTVKGIGVGIAGFAHIIQTAGKIQEIRTALPLVTSSLGTAFDTTLLALACSVIGMFYMSFLVKQQEHLFSAVDHLCFDEVCAKFVDEYSAETRDLIQAIEKAVEGLQGVMNGNRDTVTASIERRLPAQIAGELMGQIRALEDTLPRLVASELISRAEQRLVPHFEKGIRDILEALQTMRKAVASPATRANDETLLSTRR